MIHRAVALVSLLLLGCASRQTAGAVPACEVELVGPLLAPVDAPGPAPVAQGGTIVDGTYDVQWIHVHGRPGASSTQDVPSMRSAFKLTTDDRSSNHSEGILISAGENPPMRRCETGRFAVLRNVFRAQSGGRLVESGYTVAPEGIYLIRVQNGNGVAVTFLRRRP